MDSYQRYVAPHQRPPPHLWFIHEICIGKKPTCWYATSSANHATYPHHLGLILQICAIVTSELVPLKFMDAMVRRQKQSEPEKSCCMRVSIEGGFCVHRVGCCVLLIVETRHFPESERVWLQRWNTGTIYTQRDILTMLLQLDLQMSWNLQFNQARDEGVRWKSFPYHYREV